MRYRLDLAYRGSEYHGWQAQPNAKTVQGEINKALQTLFRKDIETLGSGRTDTGVHAAHQVLHLDLEEELNFDLVYKLNALLPKDIVFYSAQKVNPEFHARFDALERSYIYKINKIKNPFSIGLSYFLPRDLDVDAMNEACDAFYRYIDYECFSKTHTDVHTFNCIISHVKWVNTESGYEFHITANRFLRGMVRAIVGTLLEIGLGKKNVRHLENVIQSKYRGMAGKSVPAQGLFLSKVSY